MPEWLPVDALDRLGAFAVAIFTAGLVITDRLVWHTRLKKAESDRDRWEAVALDALRVGAHAGVKAAEVSSEVLAQLPDPAREKT